MSGVEIIEIGWTYTSPNGSQVLDMAKVVLKQAFYPIMQAAVVVLPQGVAGNHKHQKQEALVCLEKPKPEEGNVFFLWQDEHGTVHQETMCDPRAELLRLFIIPSYVPHAVRNETARRIVLLEWFDGDSEVERVELVPSQLPQ